MNLLVIGTGLMAQSIREAYPSALLLSHDQLDVLEPATIDRQLDAIAPDVVVNTAACHDLSLCERDKALAFAVNGDGARNVASRAPTIYLSTDYVFWDKGPHTEDLPGKTPRSTYGRSKLAGELATLEHGGVVVRIASVFGHYGSRGKGGSKGFPDKLLASHDPIRLPTDQRMSPTYAPDAAAIIVTLAAQLAKKEASGIYHAANRGSATWAEFAEHVLAHCRHDRHVLPYKAQDDLRPPDSSLRSTRLKHLRHWAQGLGDWAKREGHYEYVSPLRG